MRVGERVRGLSRCLVFGFLICVRLKVRAGFTFGVSSLTFFVPKSGFVPSLGD